MSCGVSQFRTFMFSFVSSSYSFVTRNLRNPSSNVRMSSGAIIDDYTTCNQRRMTFINPMT